MKATDIKADDINTWAKEIIGKKRLPAPAKPKGKDPEYTFPDDPSTLSPTGLGQQMMKFASYFGYTQWLLGLADSEFALVDSEYKVNMNVAGIKIREDLGRVAADVVEAAVLHEDESLTPLYERRQKLLVIKIQLESRLKIYEKMYNALSRELARREMETRIQ
ncbi:hypothetical protein LCGC14_1133310 [marine sediment metagenome]|uniref:Uncharacterized protein n=1 Tax=marine sediment metagenome TaxID=412755 RepID=A0A0F9M0G4_9ZZZZ